MLNKILFFSDEPPSLPKLICLNVPEQVGGSYLKFGVILLNDRTGGLVLSLKQECLGNPEQIVLMILNKWMEGKGLPVTWESLLKTLRDIKLSCLADQIHNDLTGCEPHD